MKDGGKPVVVEFQVPGSIFTCECASEERASLACDDFINKVMDTMLATYKECPTLVAVQVAALITLYLRRLYQDFGSSMTLDMHEALLKIVEVNLCPEQCDRTIH